MLINLKSIRISFWKIFLFYIVSMVILPTKSGHKVFNGHVLVRVNPKTKRDLNILKQLQHTGQVDFWVSPSSVNRSSDIHLTKKNTEAIYNLLHKENIAFSTLVDDIDALLDKQRKKPYGALQRSDATEFRYSEYHTYEEVINELHKLVKKHSTVATLINIGKSFEKREMHAVQISIDGKKQQRRLLVIECGAHAREWISPATCVFIIKTLLTKVDSDKSIKKILRKMDWTIIPFANPDGYAFTWANETNRLWRKNRSYTEGQLKLKKKTGDELCIGVDINRNYDFHWGDAAAPTSACNEMYCGPAPFSESEARNIASFLNETKDYLAGYVVLHADVQAWATPWGYKKEHSKDYKEQKRVADIAVEALNKINSVEYDARTIYDSIYPASGTSTDWAYGNLGVKYSYLVEMRDKKTFILPPDQIIPNSLEILAGLKAMVLAMKI